MAFYQKKRNPSFSSSVLDSIVRSIDESDGLQRDLRGSTNGNNENVSPSSSSSSSSSPESQKDDKLTTLRRAIMDDEHWLYARTSTTTTISSDSSAFSSSEADSYKTKRRSRILADQSNRSGDERQRIKKMSVLENDRLFSKSDDDKKLKAMMMLEEVKRSKQPLSPGARLTTFLNSIFQSNAKKVKLCSVGKTTDVKSSSSRSCFSRGRCKTDNNNNNNNCKKLERSVRFYPVRVTIDGDCRDYVQKNITCEKKPIPEFTAKNLKEEIKSKIYQNEMTCITRKVGLKDCVRSYGYEGKKEDDDAWSYSSSDLFELPVYETTDFKTNQSIARGLLL